MLITLLSLAAATAVPVEVGRFDPAHFPNAKTVERRIPHAELVRRVDNIIATKQCTIAGASKAQYDIVVPYAVLMEPDGSASKVVVKELGCAPIETLVGQVANELIRAGDFKTSNSEGERWYVSEVYFAHGGQTLARETEDPNRVICEEPRAQIGSRIAQTKVCRTAEEWRVYDADRDQAKRDLLHRGMVPGSR